MEELLTVSEVAKALKVARATVYRYIASGALPHVRIGCLIRVPKGELEQFTRTKGAA